MKLAVREALISTRAVAMCPFHPEVTIRIGDDAAETSSYRVLIFNDPDPTVMARRASERSLNLRQAMPHPLIHLNFPPEFPQMGPRLVTSSCENVLIILTAGFSPWPPVYERSGNPHSSRLLGLRSCHGRFRPHFPR